MHCSFARYQYKSFSHSIIHCCLRLDPRGRLSYLLKINLDIINLCAIFSTDELHHHLQYIFLHIRGYFQVDAEDGSRNTKTKALLRVHPADKSGLGTRPPRTFSGESLTSPGQFEKIEIKCTATILCPGMFIMQISQSKIEFFRYYTDLDIWFILLLLYL